MFTSYSQLINLYKSTTSPVTKRMAFDVGTILFYSTTVHVSDDTKYYPPTKQFFASCIEILGQVRGITLLTL